MCSRLKFKYKFKLHYLIFFPSNNCSTPIQCYDKFAMVSEKEIDLNYVPKQRETVRLKLKQLHPKGVERRTYRKLKRRIYVNIVGNTLNTSGVILINLALSFSDKVLLLKSLIDWLVTHDTNGFNKSSTFRVLPS